ncbi:sensor histidine kinase [Comamonas testosteroni]|uniref:sensor histidine kinase n=1 Tax=Comamonas testosteroni TaxID=285 RepID=UPI0005B2FD0C|nr:ATP-binding protein [Comamonas testosteroni]
MSNSSPDYRHRWLLALAWGLLCALILALQWWQAHARQEQEQLQLTQTVQRQMLEKVAQHKAHLTALTAVAPLDAAKESSALQHIAQSVQAIYPRVQEIQLVTAATPATGSCRDPAVAQTAAPLAPRASASLPDALHPGHYLFLKKIADPEGWLCVRIDSSHLLDDKVLPDDSGLRIRLHDHTLLEPAAQLQQSHKFGEFTLAGYDQPLQVQLLSRPRSLVSWSMALISTLISAMLVGAAHLIWQSRQQARRHQLRAQLLANEAQLAHASRVNGMGEMASGIAHELAQPVTALLSQSQAALRAHELGKTELLATALQANVREARRAGAILERMRSYVSNAPSQPQRLDLAQVVDQALLLLEGPARQAKVALRWQAPLQPCSAWADPVALEQVLHNLVRNALDALGQAQDAQATITITLEQSGGEALLAVQDNGPGMTAATAERIFEPFFTTKSDGMGLGLPLCATLMERMGGRLEYVPGLHGARFVMHMPLDGTDLPA